MSSRDLVAGTLVAGKYRLLEHIGGGGMGEVYRAEHQLAGRLVALKILRPDHAEDENLTRRFFQEAKAANRIQHPNIVDVLDAGFSDQGPYVAMECLEGMSLSVVLGRLGKLAPHAALSIVIPMLDALGAAHRHGIVHRDLKPENVYLARVDRDQGSGTEARVKLLDFGIAKVLDLDEDRSPRTHTGVVFGTPDYLSPEQASGEGLVDGRSDLFAVGIVLFELLTGRRPFDAPTAVATAYKIVHEPAPTLASAGTFAAPELQAALTLALAKSRAARIESASAFADLLVPLAPDEAGRREALRDVLERAAAAPPLVRTHEQAAPIPNPWAPSTIPAPPEEIHVHVDVSPLGPTERPPAPPSPPVTRPAPSRPSTTAIAAQPSTRSATTNPLPVRAASLAASRLSLADQTAPLSRTPRPLPAHLQGKCHVRGSLPRAAARWVERTHGKAALGRVLAGVAPAHAELFRTDSFNAIVWYELEALHTFFEVSNRELYPDQIAPWRQLAREHFDQDLAAMFRVARQPDARSLLRRVPSMWSKLVDFGVMRTEERTWGRTSVKVEAFEGASVSVRGMLAGTLEGVLRSGGFAGSSLRILAGDSNFARDFECEVRWVT